MKADTAFEKMSMRMFLDRVASDSPTLPAGGCAAALCSALAAALGGFVARISGKKAVDPDEKTQIDAMADTLRAIQEASLEAISRDVDAYGKIMDAAKLPRGRERDKAMESACITALGPPLTLVEYGVKMLRAILSMRERIFPAARADAQVAAHLAYACLESGLAIARANIDCIRDDTLATSYRSTLESYQAEGESLYESIRER